MLPALLVLGGCVAADKKSGQSMPAETDAPPTSWTSPFLRDHPLAGRIWAIDESRFVKPGVLLEAVEKSRFVLLGETHDNPDHHRLQAWVLKRMIESGRRPAVIFEMITVDQGAALAAQLAREPRNAAGIGAAVKWNERGWPDWEMYKPVAQAALDVGLPLAPGDLGRDTVRALGQKGAAALEPQLASRIELDRPLAPRLQRAIAEEMKHDHCGMLSDEMAGKMVTIQRARDGFMADRLMAAAASPRVNGAVLIAGGGHVRRDRGVPWQLARMVPGERSVSIGFIQVDEFQRDPAHYAGQLGTVSLPFDFVWFTPRVDLDDPCEKHADELRKLQK